jgi:hypothetical protein
MRMEPSFLLTWKMDGHTLPSMEPQPPRWQIPPGWVDQYQKIQDRLEAAREEINPAAKDRLLRDASSMACDLLKELLVSPPFEAASTKIENTGSDELAKAIHDLRDGGWTNFIDDLTDLMNASGVPSGRIRKAIEEGARKVLDADPATLVGKTAVDAFALLETETCALDPFFRDRLKRHAQHDDDEDRRHIIEATGVGLGGVLIAIVVVAAAPPVAVAAVGGAVGAAAVGTAVAAMSVIRRKHKKPGP